MVAMQGRTYLTFTELEQDIPNAELTVGVQRASVINYYVCMLTKMGFKFTYLDGQSCEAVLKSDYFDVYNKMYALLDEGFRW